MKHRSLEFSPPQYSEFALEALEKQGFESYFVGGCVRDSLLGIEVSDWDICTSALPEQTEKCFEGFRLVENGIKHGTIAVIIDGKMTEITTFRKDGDYLDRRRPSSVSFTGSLKEDLKRRDFTVNAMAFSPKRGFVDLFDGEKDLERKIIRCVGNPTERFGEDALRIMRAIRFSNKLGFEIEAETQRALFASKSLLSDIAAERITAEFLPVLISEKAGEFVEKYRCVFEVFLPEIAEFNSFSVLSRVPASPESRLAALLEKQGYDAVGETLRRLRFPGRIISRVLFLIENKRVDIMPETPLLRRLCAEFGDMGMKALIEYKMAFCEPGSSELFCLSESGKILDEIIEKDLCRSLATLAVNGNDLTAVCLTSGRETGRVLEMLFEAVICGKVENEKKQLLAYAREAAK